MKGGAILWKDGGYVDKFGNVWKKLCGNIIGKYIGMFNYLATVKNNWIGYPIVVIILM